MYSLRSKTCHKLYLTWNLKYSWLYLNGILECDYVEFGESTSRLEKSVASTFRGQLGIEYISLEFHDHL